MSAYHSWTMAPNLTTYVKLSETWTRRGHLDFASRQRAECATCVRNPGNFPVTVASGKPTQLWESPFWLVVSNMNFIFHNNYMWCHPSHWRTHSIMFQDFVKPPSRIRVHSGYWSRLQEWHPSWCNWDVGGTQCRSPLRIAKKVSESMDMMWDFHHCLKAMCL